MTKKMSLFEECMQGEWPKKFITGSTVGRYVTSPFLVWCDFFAPKDAKDPPSAYLHVLFERGIAHEKKVLDEQFGDALKIDAPSFEEGFRKVLELCGQGAKVLTQAPFFFVPEQIEGIFDVLERREGKRSIFGDHYYIVKEIKSAKNMKREYILQAAFYNYLLGKVQGVTPEVFFLIDREGKEHSYEYSQFEAELKNILDDIHAIARGKDVSPTAKACKWPWESYCIKRAVDADDVSILPSVGASAKEKLNAQGIFTVRDVLEKDFDGELTSTTKEKIRTYARAFVEKKPQIIEVPKLQQSDVELFLDFEGTDELESEEGMVKVDYLIGVLKRENGSVSFHPFVSENLQGEKQMLDEFLEFMKQYPKAPIYHYGPYEKTHMRALGEKYGINLWPIIKRMADILYVVRKCVAFPTMGNSLKDIGKFLGYEWRGMADAQESIVLYLDFLRTKDKKILQKIIDYNEDDVRATMVVKDYLAQISDKP
ncbi:TM0106 family RecB-like putative nuclease [Candidatus Woesearchaeota archaeon]|nr:MAG: TM0106 family RecB-like putative nuclease [Candidatus Woesearchaeota archaeon]